MSRHVSVIFALFGILAMLCGSQAQTGKFTTFPYCQCIPSPGAYSLEPTVKSPTKGTYCFTLKANPPPGCDNYCCARADLKKLELDVNPSCRSPGIALTATINGVRSKVAPVFDRAVLGLNGSTIIKLTQLGLNLTNANGTEICITLRTNRAGQGCTTLDDLCVPPPGAPVGTCNTALFDTTDDCCPGNPVYLRPCKTCVYFSLDPGPISRPYNLTASQCASLVAAVARDMSIKSATVNASISSNFMQVTCENNRVKVCGEFASDAEGAKLSAIIDDMAIEWLSLVTGIGNLSSSCPATLTNYTVAVNVGADGSDPQQLPPSCLRAEKVLTCTPNPFPFPKCVCETAQGVSPFAAENSVTVLPSRRSRSVLYCFTFKTINPAPGPCASSTIFQKVEIWANEAIRTKVLGFSLKAAGATAWRNISASWGGKGEETLKATAVNWGLTEANGGMVCAELDLSVTLNQLCLGPQENSCWVNIFDPSRTCCPLFPVNFTP